MRRKVFKRENIMCGQANNLARIDGAGQLASRLEHRLQCFCGLVVGDNYDDRLLGGPRHQRNIESPRCYGETRDTSPPRTKAQMPSNAIKSRNLLQLRKDFADKRENHRIPSLPASAMRQMTR